MMKPGTTLEQRDIVLVPAPFTDLSAMKRRPVLVLSTSEFNARSSDVIVAGITSNLGRVMHGRIIDSPDLETGSLARRSCIRSDRIYTLKKDLVVKRFGRLGEAAFQDVLKAVDQIFGRASNR